MLVVRTTNRKVFTNRLNLSLWHAQQSQARKIHSHMNKTESKSERDDDGVI
jgi:hypothetical protein